MGVIGHSFGGYTALALAGATIDFDSLKETCERKVWAPNMSLLMQCRGLELPLQEYNFRDERIQAVFALNPVNSVIFGENGLKQIDIPVFFGAGSDDPATPAAIEQVKSFIWLNPEDKYLGLVVGQAHVNFSQLDAATETVVELFPDFAIPDQSLLDQYANAFILAFNELYIAQNQDYKPYLTSGYSKYMSGDINPVYFVPFSAEQPLSELFNRLKPSEFPDINPPDRSLSSK